MTISIIGATGLVGREVLKILYQHKLIDNNKIYLFASEKSDGKIITIEGHRHIIRGLSQNSLPKHCDIAFFCAGKEISLRWANKFVGLGAYVIDNSSAYRRDKSVPLVTPEVNAETINKSTKIIANPNCSSIGAVLPIYALSQLYSIKRIIISTYQAVSGAGQKGILDLKNKTINHFPYRINNNLIPQIDRMLDNGYTYEEDKMEFELKKMLNNNKIKICATCVRVPIENCHSESINIEFYEQPNINNICESLQQQDGIELYNDLAKNKYPMPIVANNQDNIIVGRIRKDTSNNKSINMFISFDNIRKGAGLNAVQIAEQLIIKHLI